ncbi:MAG: hypothetical protein IMHGJWDQ_002242 [Candidatus Fervidibacter sp.]
MTVSVVVLTRNEAANIARCLKSVQWADEIVVVDAESMDETCKIAERMGARVIVHPWEGEGRQADFALAQARGEWVLMVDADEEVSPALASAIREVVKRSEPFVAYKVLRVDRVLGRWLRHGGFYPHSEDFAEWWLRNLRRARIEAEWDFLNGKRFNPFAVLGAFWKFFRRFVLKDGFLDGWAGFFACAERAFYILAKQACLLELQRGLRQPTEWQKPYK